MEEDKVVDAEVVNEESAAEKMSDDEKNMGMLCSLLQLLIFTWLGGLLATLIFWLVMKDKYPFVDRVGREVVNFQLSILIYSIVCGLLAHFFSGILLAALSIFAIVVIITGTVKASQGIVYTYPLAIRFLK